MTETINSFALRFVSILVRDLVAVLNKLKVSQWLQRTLSPWDITVNISLREWPGTQLVSREQLCALNRWVIFFLAVSLVDSVSPFYKWLCSLGSPEKQM